MLNNFNPARYYKNWLKHILLCCHLNQLHYKAYPKPIQLSVLMMHLCACVSVCPVWVFNLKTTSRRKTKIGVNISLGWSKWCANFLCLKSMMKVTRCISLNVYISFSSLVAARLACDAPGQPRHSRWGCSADLGSIIVGWNKCCLTNRQCLKQNVPNDLMSVFNCLCVYRWRLFDVYLHAAVCAGWWLWVAVCWSLERGSGELVLGMLNSFFPNLNFDR